MVIVKWFLRVLAALIVLPIAAMGIFASWNWLQLRPDAKFTGYLEKNASAIDLGAGTPFAISEEDLGARLIVLGEVHGIKIGQDLDFALLRMLNARKKIRHYAGEFDPAQAAEFNAYLGDGDEARLRRVFSLWAAENAQWGNREFMAKIRQIKAWNDTLPADRKIVFIGMDRVQDMPLMAAHLDAALAGVPDATWPGKAALVAALQEKAARTDSKPKSLLPLAAVEAAKTMPAAAPAGTDPNSWRFIRSAVLNLSDLALLKGRESAITAAFERLASDPLYAGEAFYGFWGQFHVLNATIQGGKPFVRRLHEGKSDFAGKITSLNIINVDCQMLMPAKSFGSSDPYVEIPYSLDNPLLLFVNGINDVKQATTKPLTLFKMNAPGSPYPGTNTLGAVGGLLGLLQPFVVDAASVGPDGATDYAILAKGSGAVAALTASDLAGKSQ